MQLYAVLMDEVKVRLALVDQALAGTNSWPGLIVNEFCYLQFRIICELIAIASLALHNEIPSTQVPKFRNEHSADKLIKMLSSVHPDFYPIPILAPKRQAPGTGVDWHIEDMSTGFLTRPQLQALYGRTGNYAHRGSLKKIIERGTPLETQFPEISRDRNALVNLLSRHRIRMSQGGKIAIFELHFADPTRNAELLMSSPN